MGHVDALAADGNRVPVWARFATSPEAQQILADVKAGIHRSLSVGYQHIGEGRHLHPSPARVPGFFVG